MNGWEPGGNLAKIWSHLHCAIVVAIASDNAIVMDHVEAAYTLLEEERQKAINEEMMSTGTEPDYFAEAVARAREHARGLRNLSMLHARQLDGCLDIIERIHRETIANARAQAAAVTGPEKRQEVEACLDRAERAAVDSPSPFQALVNDPTFLRRP